MLAYESLVISKNIMNGCCKASHASAFARQRRIFDGIDALYAFYRMFKLTKHSFLNSIRF